jgi:phosphoribulokinase
MESEEQLRKILQEMQQETASVRGDEFGLFDYNDLDRETQEAKWQIIAYIMDMGRIKGEDVAKLLQNNPWFNEWYRRMILSDKPMEETYH